jgi:hypothetical protein
MKIFIIFVINNIETRKNENCFIINTINKQQFFMPYPWPRSGMKNIRKG